ncbi:unnamed protein product [Mytilus edulis]|uniref:Uncharacterized protein n=1 Tax=Mytilus edulis TaxID=6550 RepID=A0A8S3PW84_MYTED|nr:unnamed protein product [Mytilus edulis]
MASLKMICPLFHAFDRPLYLKLVPYHLADLLTFPQPILDFFSLGAFAVSITGTDLNCVALDEAHETQINLQTKQALNSTTKQSLASTCLSLPFRAKVLQNLKKQLLIKHQNSTIGEISIRQNDEKNIQEYMKSLDTSYLFTNETNTKLHQIFTGEICAPNISSDMLNYRKYGEEDFKSFINCVVLKNKKVPRKRRNLKTFSTIITKNNQQQKKELQDNKTVIHCLRKQLAYSKTLEKPVEELHQLNKLPRAICTADELPIKGEKSGVVNLFKSLYSSSYTDSLSFTNSNTTGIILEGMFIINSRPLGYHVSFLQYASFLFDRWVLNFYARYNASEIHVLFDDPERNCPSPKDVERASRDLGHQHHIEISDSISISDSTPLPSDWQKFLFNRQNKRKLVQYLSVKFLELSKTHDFVFVTAGGFEGNNKDKAICVLEGEIFEYSKANGNHEESDSRVWLHASASPCLNILIYSPDTDVCFVGLPLIMSADSLKNKTIFIQLKDNKFEKKFLDMNALSCEIATDLLLQNIQHLHKCLQTLFILSGCDYLSFFRGFTNRIVFDNFRKHCHFITGTEFPGSLSENTPNGLLAFYRLIGTLYFLKHRTAFPENISSPKKPFHSSKIP